MFDNYDKFKSELETFDSWEKPDVIFHPFGQKDMVNSPPHYNKAGIECIEAIKAMLGSGFKYYLQGNIMKYLWRYRYKDGVQDLKKAQWYLSELIDNVEENDTT